MNVALSSRFIDMKSPNFPSTKTSTGKNICKNVISHSLAEQSIYSPTRSNG